MNSIPNVELLVLVPLLDETVGNASLAEDILDHLTEDASMTRCVGRSYNLNHQMDQFVFEYQHETVESVRDWNASCLISRLSA